MRPNGFVDGGHECIDALRGCFDTAAEGRIDVPLLQILVCSRPVRLCDRECVHSTDSWISLVKKFGKFGPQRGWNYCTFPEQNESFLHREALSASVETELRPVGVLAETSEVRPARLDEFLHSLKQYILFGNGTEPIEYDGD
jgi:hypothetical protein